MATHIWSYTMSKLHTPETIVLTKEQSERLSSRWARNLGRKIPRMNEAYTPYDQEWKELVAPLVERCNKLGVTILQIKEKFGGLRFYFSTAETPNPDSEEVVKLCEDIYEAENASYTMCEVCCKPGILRGDRRLMTTCDEHNIFKAQ